MTDGAVHVAAHRLRRRFREVLRERVAATIGDPAGVDEEIHELFKALGP
jgi:RNA polymerase sigma-70 factor (ECF subfamily)